MTRVWMDQGGTFTDVLRLAPDGTVQATKIWSDLACLSELGAGDPSPRRGTTVATNALLERKGAPVLLLTTAGFGDMPRIGDQTRPHLFDRRLGRPPPLCTGVVEVQGRIAADGAVVAPASVDPQALLHWQRLGVDSVAIVLVHGPLHPDSERALGEACRTAGFRTVCLGHEVAPSMGFLARLHTTLADAALTPLLPTASGLYMRSDGGLAEQAQWRGCDAVLSGPAGGVVAAARLAAEAGVGPAFGLDMGGTSTDVCRVDGEPGRTDHLEVGGMRLRVPAVRLQTVAAGGGSILGLHGGVMEVGPASAGAMPGPAAYGRGGPATLTDAVAVLGHLPDFPTSCGWNRDQPLDTEAAHQAIAALGLDLDLVEAAAGFVRIAAETAARAVRALAAAQGVDPAAHALVAFGGAGPGHGCAVAEALGIQTVLVPRLAGVFSALGVGTARRRAEVTVPIKESIQAAWDAAVLPFHGEVRARLAARHVGTDTLIEIPLEPGLSGLDGVEIPPSLEAAFAQAHLNCFGFARPGLAVEPVEVRVSVTAKAEALPALRVEERQTEASTTKAWFDGWRTVEVREMATADGVDGPALLTGGGTTVVVPPGWSVRVHPTHLLLQATEVAAPRLGLEAHPVHTAVLGSRVMAIAEQMGERLARLARSVSIRERRDFSCAVFDAGGRLVANAPHVPVHLGAMGETVRDLLDRHTEALAPGQAWASNDPYAGGTHLPDITVTRPLFDGEERVGFVACRGHHIDVGGIQPGSMPPHATHIDEEGFRLDQVLLADGTGFHPPPLPGCRQPEDVLCDLEAQVAACAAGAAGLDELREAVGTPVLTAQFAHLQDQGEDSVCAVLRDMEGVHHAEEILDDGTRIGVCLEVQDGRAVLRIEAPAHPGNLNAPRAVARASVLYVFRSLVEVGLPILNEGALRPIEIQLESGGLFDPQHPAAVAGGNVETSQRLVDALLRAVGAQAGSQGTMNNLTVGTPSGTFYETIAGGAGAGPGFDGPSAQQVHMTNTRATDVEVLESRFPVRMRRFALREGSGGSGEHRGGDGVIKEWEFLAPAQVAILAGRRNAGAPGLEGGMPGAPGAESLYRHGKWNPAPARVAAETGEVLRVCTPGGGGWGRPTEGP